MKKLLTIAVVAAAVLAVPMALAQKAGPPPTQGDVADRAQSEAEAKAKRRAQANAEMKARGQQVPQREEEEEEARKRR